MGCDIGRRLATGVVGLLLLGGVACGGATGSAGVQLSTPAAAPSAPAGRAVGVSPTVAAPAGRGTALAPTPPAPTAAPAKPAQATIGGRVALAGVAITLHKATDNAPPGAIAPQPGTRRYAVEISIENTSRQPQPYSAYFAKVKLADDSEHTGFVSTEPAPAIAGGAVAPGETLRGWLSFDLPIGAQPAQFIYDDLSEQAIFSLR